MFNFLYLEFSVNVDAMDINSAATACSQIRNSATTTTTTTTTSSTTTTQQQLQNNHNNGIADRCGPAL